MKDYTWYYGLFHWTIHFLITIGILYFSGIVIFPIYATYIIFGNSYSVNVVDYIMALTITMLFDLDHMSMWKKVGIKKMMYIQKKLVSPMHNFFFISLFSIMSALAAIYFSRELGVLLLVIVAHMLWDISEDVFVYRVSFRRWERTWGLNKRDLENAYKDLLNLEPRIDPPLEKKISRLRKAATSIRQRMRRKLRVPAV